MNCDCAGDWSVRKMRWVVTGKLLNTNKTQIRQNNETILVLLRDVIVTTTFCPNIVLSWRADCQWNSSRIFDGSGDVCTFLFYYENAVAREIEYRKTLYKLWPHLDGEARLDFLVHSQSIDPFRPKHQASRRSRRLFSRKLWRKNSQKTSCRKPPILFCGPVSTKKKSSVSVQLQPWTYHKLQHSQCIAEFLHISSWRRPS